MIDREEIVTKICQGVLIAFLFVVMVWPIAAAVYFDQPLWFFVYIGYVVLDPILEWFGIV